MAETKTAARTEATTTTASDRSPGIERNTALGRATHTAVYLLTFGLFGTGFWLLTGREGRPSVLSLLLGASDTDIHKALGWGLTALGALAVAGHFGAVVSFFSESVRFSHGDGTWLKAWPRAAVSGRFQRHEGHFDPGQRIANLLLVGGLGVLVASGIGLVIVRGGMTFVWLHRIHLWATYGTAVIIAGHIVVASGVLPGYRGVWRAMHGRGRVPETTAHRLWPTWFEPRLAVRGRRDVLRWAIGRAGEICSNGLQATPRTLRTPTAPHRYQPGVQTLKRPPGPMSPSTIARRAPARAWLQKRAR